MSNQMKCGEGEFCAKCKIYEAMRKIGLFPQFTKNAIDRCDWYVSLDDKPVSERG